MKNDDSRFEPSCGAVPFSAPAVERGMGFFETLLAVRKRLLFWDEHVSRLLATLARLDLPSPTRASIGDHAERVLRADQTAAAERALRIAWIAIGPDLEAARSWRLDVSTREVPESTRARRTGASVVSLPSDLSRDTATMKSTSYVSAVLGLRHARKQGADEGLFRAPDGAYLEGTSTGLVLWNGGHPCLASGAALPSITSAALAGAGAPRRAIGAADIRAGAMLAGALTLAAPIASLDGAPCAQPAEMLARAADFNAQLLR